MSKIEFKSFVRKHPELVNTVLENNNITWQKLYEMYELYGETSIIWDKYITKNSTDSISSTISNFISTLKDIDINTVQTGIENIQKTIGLLQDIGLNKMDNTSSYEPRPLYQHFDD